MKTKFTFLALMLCAALMVSCSKDNDSGNTPNDDITTGEPTYMTLNLKVLGANATKAMANLTATTAEAAVNDVRIYVFNKRNTNYILEAEVDFDNSDASTFKKTFQITTGQKIIHALVNMSGVYPSATIGTTSLDQFKESTLSLGSAITTAATDNAFWMTTLEDVNQTIVIATQAEAEAGTYNNVTLSVGRAVAKIGVDLDPDTVDQPTDGLLSDVTYKVVNNPNAMYALKVFNAAGYQLTPYYLLSYLTKGTDSFENGIYLPTTKDDGGYHAAPSYMVENSHDVPTYGNSNVVMIKGTFRPNLLYNADGTTYFDITTPAGLNNLETELTTTWDGTFWRIYDSSTNLYGSKFYYETPVIVSPNDEAIKYAEGTAYYGLWLENSTKSTSVERYTVSRNQYWNVTITTIAGCGSNSEEGVIDEPGKEEPIKENTYMTGLIKVLDWEEVTQQGGI